MKVFVVRFMRVVAWLNLVLGIIFLINEPPQKAIKIFRDSSPIYKDDETQIILTLLVYLLVFCLTYAMSYIVEAACKYLEKEKKNKEMSEVQKTQPQKN